MYFLVNASPSQPLDVATSNFAGAIGHMMQRVLSGNIFCAETLTHSQSSCTKLKIVWYPDQILHSIWFTIYTCKNAGLLLFLFV